MTAGNRGTGIYMAFSHELRRTTGHQQFYVPAWRQHPEELVDQAADLGYDAIGDNRP
jgi:hypothetical protein